MSGIKLTMTILLILGSMAICARAQGTIEPQPTSAEPTATEAIVAEPTATEYLDLIQALRDLHYDKYLVTPPLAADHLQAQGWDLYRYSTEDLRCIAGGEYFIMARRGTQADKTVIYFEGGGACWPGREECTTEARFNRLILDRGIASLDANNPVRNWNFIYVPYCDGSIHLGDNDADYDANGVVDHWHWGLRTTSAAVQLMAELFPDSQSILISGCSAGGAGTIGATPVVRLQFPEARLYVFSVSGLSLINPEEPELYDVLKEYWNIGQFIPSDCPSCNEQLVYIHSWLLERDPALRVGMYSSYHDAVSSSGRGMSPEAFEALALSTTAAIGADHPSTFHRYFVEGDMHCIEDYGYAVNGVSLWDWVGYLVNEDPRWIDVLE